MRNLKRALSLTLASIMLLGMMVVGSSAASYQDVTDEHNVEAIEVLQTVGIMVGDDGNFNPDKNVTRNEMAVIMSNLMDYRVASYSGTSPFTDVPSWAEPYVAACYTNGITSGTSATTYNGSGNVTTAQAALMIMKALGYFQYTADFGDDWMLAATRQANSIDLLIDVKSGVREAMTRNDVAQLVLNALETGMVEADDSSKVEVTNGDMQVSVGGTKYVYVTSREKYAKAIKDAESLQYGATSTSNLSAPIVELGEKLYQGDLIKKAWESGNTDDFGRPANTWTYQAKDIGSYAEEVEEGLTFTAKVTSKKLYNAVGKTAAEKYDWAIYENGEPLNPVKVKDEDGREYLSNFSYINGFDSLVNNQTNDSADFYKLATKGQENSYNLTGNGVLTQVYVDGTNETVTVAVTYFYPAEIYRVNSTDGKIILNSLEGTDKDGRVWGPATTTDEFSATGFEDDEIVYYTWAKSKIQSVAKAERIEGDVTKVVANTADADGSNFSLDDNVYKYNMTMKSNKLTTENVDNNMAGYIDANNYVVYIDKSAVTYDYAYVLSIGTDGDKADETNVNSTVWARLLLTDGSMVTVETDAKKADVDSQKFLNHIVSYSKNSAGVYTLAVKDKDDGKSTNGTDSIKPVTNIGQDIFENGKSPVHTQVDGMPQFIANSNTVMLTVDTNNSPYFSDWSYSVYTGIKNIPDIKSQAGTKICVAANEMNVAKVIYVENGDVSGTGDAIFVLADGGDDLTLISGSTKYYELTAYVNGEAETIKVKKDSKADDALVHFDLDNPEWKSVAVNVVDDQWIVPVRTMSVDNDGLVTSVRVHDEYGVDGTNGSKAKAGAETGRDRTTGNEVIYLGSSARSWTEGAKLVQYNVKNDAWTQNIKISSTSVKDDKNDQWVAIYDDGEIVGLFIKEVPGNTSDGGDTPDQDYEVTVNFTAAEADVKNGDAAVTNGQKITVEAGKTLTLTVTAKDGFKIKEVSNAEKTGTNTYVVKSAAAVTVTTEPVASFTLNLNGDLADATVKADGKVLTGTDTVDGTQFKVPEGAKVMVSDNDIAADGTVWVGEKKDIKATSNSTTKRISFTMSGNVTLEGSAAVAATYAVHMGEGVTALTFKKSGSEIASADVEQKGDTYYVKASAAVDEISVTTSAADNAIAVPAAGFTVVSKDSNEYHGKTAGKGKDIAITDVGGLSKDLYVYPAVVVEFDNTTANGKYLFNGQAIANDWDTFYVAPNQELAAIKNGADALIAGATNPYCADPDATTIFKESIKVAKADLKLWGAYKVTVHGADSVKVDDSSTGKTLKSGGFIVIGGSVFNEVGTGKYVVDEANPFVVNPSNTSKMTITWYDTHLWLATKLTITKDTAIAVRMEGKAGWDTVAAAGTSGDSANTIVYVKPNTEIGVAAPAGKTLVITKTTPAATGTVPTGAEGGTQSAAFKVNEVDLTLNVNP